MFGIAKHMLIVVCVCFTGNLATVVISIVVIVYVNAVPTPAWARVGPAVFVNK